MSPGRRLSFEIARLHANLGPNKGIKYPFQEEKVPNLLNRFFHLVHIKNPIIDQEELQKDARRVIEDGLNWDEGSCLVLLVCALGRIAQPFRSGEQTGSLDSTGYRELSSPLDCPDLEEAESYFSLALRRIGILNQSVAAVQCLFLCGVFYMYTFRPLEAFQSFHQASVMYQVYLRSHKGSTTVLSDNQTEQTLFWSCFKSEWGSRESAHHDMSAHEQQQAWFYYLSEIALRRIGNRVLNSLYKESFESWKEYDIPSTIKIAHEFLRQLNEWYEGLPVSMHFDDNRPWSFPPRGAALSTVYPFTRDSVLDTAATLVPRYSFTA
ncbi:hypothetical protein N7486_010472 [Penicillium sp. IBT 16267x]|nr:hypothetical protein N7486_010472 [Penicillium sp. IBT 16267x]